MRKHFFILTFCLFILLKTWIFTTVIFSSRHPVPGGNILISIPPGQSASQIGKILADSGLSISPRIFSIAAIITGNDDKLGSGVYSIGPDFTLRELLSTLRKGQGYSIPVRITEGARLNEVARKISSELGLEESLILKLVKDSAFVDSLLPGESSLEGFIYPDTYMFPVNTNERKVLRSMVERFSQIFNDSMIEKANMIGLSMRDAVILASIIEKEARVPMERKLISAVFHNRLRLRRPIESCATIRYIMNKPTEPLTYQDLEVRSPYNTYLNLGLPPGPICNPGKASLEAAVSPAKVDYLYFVSRGDGTHIFSRTLTEHNFAKRKIKGANKGIN